LKILLEGKRWLRPCVRRHIVRLVPDS
jgi:hypothetical protein